MNEFGKITKPPNHLTNTALLKERDLYYDISYDLNEWGSNHDFVKKNLFNRVKDLPHKAGKDRSGGVE